MNSNVPERFNKEGYLAVYAGPMFAGKSKLLIKKLSKKQDLGLKVVYVTHGDDDRITKGSNCKVNTHWTCFKNAIVSFDCYKTTDLACIYSRLCQYDVIGIDEYQFFNIKAVEVVRELVESAYKRVYSVGLDCNFKREKFGYIFELFYFADKYKKIQAKCETCKQAMSRLVSMNLSPHAAFVSASFTAKIGGDINVEKEAGSEEMYNPLCRYHYREYAEKWLKSFDQNPSKKENSHNEDDDKSNHGEYLMFDN